eukprot:1806197-Rhodomonas_salina.1
MTDDEHIIAMIEQIIGDDSTMTTDARKFSVLKKIEETYPRLDKIAPGPKSGRPKSIANWKEGIAGRKKEERSAETVTEEPKHTPIAATSVPIQADKPPGLPPRSNLSRQRRSWRTTSTLN